MPQRLAATHTLPMLRTLVTVCLLCFLSFAPHRVSSTSQDKDGAAEDILVHLHIPKTGGAFVRKQLREAFVKRGQGFYSSGLKGGKSFLTKSAEEQARVAALHGHFGYGIHLQAGWKLGGGVRRRRPVYTTVLREPVDRLVSQFQYEVRSPLRMILKSKVPPNGESLTEAHLFSWLEDVVARRSNNTMWSAHNNPMTQQLCCFADDTGFRTTFGGGGSGDGVNSLCDGAVTEATLQCALNNLATFEVVGVMERMDETLALFAAAIGLDIPAGGVQVDKAHRNEASSTGRVVISTEGRERLAAFCRFDQELYDEALRIFERLRKQHLSSSVTREL